jgi:hypothetical protein
LGGCGSGHCRSGCGLLVVLVDDLGVLVDPGVLNECGDLVQPGYERLGHGSFGAERQLLHC